MRFYQQQHPYYCGIDLHARTMHVCVVDDSGLTREHVGYGLGSGVQISKLAYPRGIIFDAVRPFLKFERLTPDCGVTPHWTRRESRANPFEAPDGGARMSF